MIDVNMNTRINRSPKEVFSFLVAHENDSQWQYGTFASARIPRRINDTKNFFRSIGHLMGRRNLSTFEVTEFEPHKRYGFKSLTGLLDVQATYTLEGVFGETKLNTSIQANLLNFGPVKESILEKMINEQLTKNLEKLKSLLESRTTMPSSERVYLSGG